MFSWDETKREKVLSEHKIDFAKIMDIFEDLFSIDFIDDEHSSEDEPRFAKIGITAKYGLVFLVYTLTETENVHLLRPVAQKILWWGNMKKEKDTESFSEKMKTKGWREIERPKIPGPPLQPFYPSEIKSRITIYLDADIVQYFKNLAEDSGNGYQTLINKCLREVVNEQVSAKNYENLMEALESLKPDLRNPENLNLLAMVCLQQKKYEKAAELLREALKIEIDMDLKQDILQDKNFLHELKEALALKP